MPSLPSSLLPLSASSVRFINEIFGGVTILTKSRVFYAINVHAAAVDNSFLNVIVKNEHSPCMEIDWEMFSFLRVLTSVSILSGETVRKEREHTSLTRVETFKRSDWLQMYRAREYSTFVVLSKTMTVVDIMNIPMFAALPAVKKVITMTPEIE